MSKQPTIAAASAEADEPGMRAVDSINHLVPGDRGKVVVAGSHGGLYCAFKALAVGARGVILNDAGRGRNDAGIAALAYCERHDMAAAAISHASARIGDAADMLGRGRVSEANAVARMLGVTPGLACRQAARLFGAAAVAERRTREEIHEHRYEVALDASWPAIVCIDSASLIEPADSGRIVVTGSHGGLIGGDAAKAINIPCAFAAFNDAGIGADDAGVSRLPALDGRHIPAVTVGHMTAEIGNARSTLEDGVISRVNGAARALGMEPGMELKRMLRQFLEGKENTRLGADFGPE